MSLYKKYTGVCDNDFTAHGSARRQTRSCCTKRSIASLEGAVLGRVRTGAEPCWAALGRCKRVAPRALDPLAPLGLRDAWVRRVLLHLLLLRRARLRVLPPQLPHLKTV